MATTPKKRMREIEEISKNLEIAITSKYFPEHLKPDAVKNLRLLLSEWLALLIEETKKTEPAKPL